MTRARKAGLAAVCGVAAIAGVAWLSGWTEAVRPNVLLITFDTTRADRLGAYGWRHGRTPAVDGLAERGILFNRAYASVPLTLPSHASILTGMHPFYLGVRDNAHFQLDSKARTLAEVLHEQGYQTGAVVASFVLDARFGLDQGFDDYRDDLADPLEFDAFQVPERNARAVVDDSLDWLRQADKNPPFFLWTHFYDPHHPYHTPPNFPFYQSHPYDLEIAYADFHLSRLLEAMEGSPPNDRPTLIVFAADHGEALGEYGEETHGYFVYDSTLHVPLVIKLPDGSRAGTRIGAPVGLIDLMPTILELVGLPPPTEDEIHGRSLVGLMNGEAASTEAFESRPLYFECFMPMYDFGWAPTYGIRLDQTKFIESPIPELYLLADNAREGQPNNVFEEHPDLASQLSDRLQALLDTPLRQPALSGTIEEVDPEVVQNLAALGYLTGTTIQEEDFDLDDDVKNRLSLHNLIQIAGARLSAGDVAVGTHMLMEVIEEDPENPRALALLGETIVKHPEKAAAGLPVLEAASRNSRLDAGMRARLMGQCGEVFLIERDPQRALAFINDAVHLQPDDAGLLGRLATAQMHLAQIPDALDTTRRAIECAPNFASLHVQLGLLLFCEGRIEEGAETWNGLLARDDTRLTTWQAASMCARDPAIAEMAMEPLSRVGAQTDLPGLVRAVALAATGQVHLNAGRSESALSAFEAACSLLPPGDGEGLWWRSRALISLERVEQALPLLESAYQKRAGDIRIVVDLARAYSQRGDTAKSVELLSDYYEAHPDRSAAANNLAWALADRAEGEADLERALRLAKFAVEKHESNASFSDTLGWIHLKRNDAESAVFALQRAIGLSPQEAEYHYHLGLAYRLRGQADRARGAFAKAVELAASPYPPWFEDALAGSSPDDAGR